MMPVLSWNIPCDTRQIAGIAKFVKIENMRIRLREQSRHNGTTYKFTTSDTITGGGSGANGTFVSQEYTNLVRKEPE